MNLEQVSGMDLIFVMSFHFSIYDFTESDFPYKRGEG